MAKKEWSKPSPKLMEKTHHLMHDGFHQRAFPNTPYELPEALGDARWTDELIASAWYMAETGESVPTTSTTRRGGAVEVLTNWPSRNCQKSNISHPTLKSTSPMS